MRQIDGDIDAPVAAAAKSETVVPEDEILVPEFMEQPVNTKTEDSAPKIVVPAVETIPQEMPKLEIEKGFESVVTDELNQCFDAVKEFTDLANIINMANF